MIPTNKDPLVSVILPIYNGAEYLAESIDSILNQTYRNIELILIDDGSKDDSWKIISSYFHDPRVRGYQQENQGLAATLNRGILLAKGDFCARQDQDDISLPHRLETQMRYFIENPECDLVGSWAQIIEDSTLTPRRLAHPSRDEDIKTFLLFDTPFVHTSVLFKKASVVNAGLYTTDKNLQPPEDYELWARMAPTSVFYNVPEILVHYREIQSSLSRTIGHTFIEKMIFASDRYSEKILDKKSEFASLSLARVYFQLITKEELPSWFHIFRKYKAIWKKLHGKDPFSKIAYRQLKRLFLNYVKVSLNFNQKN